ncbi:hypothetical protein AB9P05_03895 [Roseivirga sp. BDSF3-8]|uniref:hypothetical protein n=1 Tax=Roseivirga sp. BDSF3-8 TaxID=3241598 RepID=UPI003531D183
MAKQTITCFIWFCILLMLNGGYLPVAAAQTASTHTEGSPTASTIAAKGPDQPGEADKLSQGQDTDPYLHLFLSESEGEETETEGGADSLCTPQCLFAPLYTFTPSAGPCPQHQYSHFHRRYSGLSPPYTPEPIP